MTILRSRVQFPVVVGIFFLVFEVSISNQPESRTDQGSEIKNPVKRIFWPPEGHKVKQPRTENLQTAILNDL